MNSLERRQNIALIISTTNYTHHAFKLQFQWNVGQTRQCFAESAFQAVERFG